MTYEEKKEIIFIYAYVQSAIETIENALTPLKTQLFVLNNLITEKSAPTAPTVEAASENITPKVYNGNGSLSSVPIGTYVDTPEGNGTVKGCLSNGDIEVEMDSSVEAFSPFDIKPIKGGQNQ